MAGKPSFLADSTDEEGFTPEEKALMTDAPEGDEPQGEETSPETAEEAEKVDQAPEQKADAVKPPAQAEKEHTGDLGKALKEERERRREVEQRIARMEGAWQQVQQRINQPSPPNGQQQPAQTVPSYDQDPIGYLKAQNEQLAQQLHALSGHAQQQAQVGQQQQFYSDVMNRYEASRSQFVRQQPDYAEADAWLRQNIDAELEARGFDDPAERKAVMEREEGFLVYRALASGKNPAEQIYRLAQHRGFKKPALAAEENKLDRLTRGQKASASLGATKNAPGGKPELTLEHLATLSGADFDRAWAMMEKRGLLG